MVRAARTIPQPLSSEALRKPQGRRFCAPLPFWVSVSLVSHETAETIQATDLNGASSLRLACGWARADHS